MYTVWNTTIKLSTALRNDMQHVSHAQNLGGRMHEFSVASRSVCRIMINHTQMDRIVFLTKIPVCHQLQSIFISPKSIFLHKFKTVLYKIQ